MIKNKVERKLFLGMEVRVVNNEYIYDEKGVYLIKFKDSKYKIGGTIDFTKRISYYKPYAYIIEEIYFFKTKYYYELEKILIRSNRDNVFYGVEWFDGCPNFDYFLKNCNDSYEDIDKNNKECVRQCLPVHDRLNDIIMLFPSKKKNELEDVINIINSTLKEVLCIDNNIYKFIHFYNTQLSDKIKNQLAFLLLGKPKSIDVLIKILNVYLGEGKHILGNILYLNKFLNKFDDESVREFVLEKFVNAYEFTNSHKLAAEMSEKLARKKYNL